MIAIAIGSIADATAAPTKPEIQTAEWAQSWWMPRHEAKLAEARERADEIDLVFIGDSITHNFDKGLWAKHLASYGAFNLGFSGDGTEHALWRIEHGALDNLSPKLVVIMIGTNNTGNTRDEPEDTARGIEAVVRETKEQLPDAEILLLAVFPRSRESDDPMRQTNEAINELLPAIAERQGVDFANINNIFLQRKNKILPVNVMPDSLHPNEFGYELWIHAMMPIVKRYFEEPKMKNEPPILALWPEEPPGRAHPGPERRIPKENDYHFTDIKVPSIKLYHAPDRRHKNVPFVLIAPGGGYHILSWIKEGEEIAEWLNSIGFSAGVLKYRVPKTREGALQDIQRAMGIVRSHAEDWNLDTKRIGALGFSAGGHLTARLASSYQSRAYPIIDEADELPCRPDFTVLIYPAYLADENLNLSPEIVVDADTPPCFLLQTQDDGKHIYGSVGYYVSLLKQGIPAEIHLFQDGGHGYGLRPSAYPVSRWSDLCRDWLLRL